MDIGLTALIVYGIGVTIMIGILITQYHMRNNADYRKRMAELSRKVVQQRRRRHG